MGCRSCWLPGTHWVGGRTDRCALLGYATLLRLADRSNVTACSRFAGLLRMGGSERDKVEREGKLLACF
jgi:hypothetical protein